MSFELTESEAQRYDRQIRVWGAEAQSRIQNSRVLVCGLSKMNVEVVKNIVLAGMNVTLQGSRNAHFDDVAHNFFLSVEDVGKPITSAILPRVQELNAFASVLSENRTLQELPDEFFLGFSVILLTECSETQALRINKLARTTTPQSVFFWSDMFGDEGLFYADFGDSFSYKEDKAPGNANDSSAVAAAKEVQKIKTTSFPALETVLSKKWTEITSRHFPLSKVYVKHRLLESFRASHGHEPTPEDAPLLEESLRSLQQANNFPVEPAVLSAADLHSLSRVAGTSSVLAASVLGSYLSQEVVKAVSLTGEPALNVFVFSASDYEAKAFPVR